ncbi:hypothetical protein [Streptomyces sp. A012304]|uniref:hypothetical protein n=1 Tax=Streptomyces sp. A012304 TaxID=375446 RepID=UPI0022301FCE|nr:hypothetical protein [Streptomyces sp. A012304]GKQ38479.1 hypothetical protein ALMP_50100 [Streptomyces sp. A012304]
MQVQSQAVLVVDPDAAAVDAALRQVGVGEDVLPRTGVDGDGDVLQAPVRRVPLGLHADADRVAVQIGGVQGGLARIVAVGVLDVGAFTEDEGCLGSAAEVVVASGGQAELLTDDAQPDRRAGVGVCHTPRFRSRQRSW